MDLKKSKKKLKQKLREANPFVGVHVYRSLDKNAPFSEWERITTRPVQKDFTDEDAKRRAVFYYYKLTDVDHEGIEGEPRNQNTFTQNGRQIERTPETAVMGSYLYWTTDADLPLDQWTKIDELVTDENASFQSPVKETFYVYSVSVNFFGREIQRSGIQKVIYKGPK
ncbi:MAG TPA: hypothetical protein VGC76_05615 [Pyrinomonadaceae bacterium]|jgi:hypothetical protein